MNENLRGKRQEARGKIQAVKLLILLPVSCLLTSASCFTKIMSVTQFISRRFNSRKHLPRSIRAMRIVSITGISIAVAALVIAISIGRGFEKNYRKALMDFNAHVVVMGSGEIPDRAEIADKLAAVAKDNGITGMTPFLYREALAIGGGKIKGVVVKGIDVGTLKDVNSMEVDLGDKETTIEKALGLGGKGGRAVIMGRSLARDMGLDNIGAVFKMLIPREGEKRKGARQFENARVAGFFESGMNDYDAQFILMPLSEAEILFGAPRGTITGIELKLDLPENSRAVAEKIEKYIGPVYRAIAWSELNRDLLLAVKLEKLVSSIIMGIMVIIAVLNIVAVLVLTAIHRLLEISILKSIGLSNKSVWALLVCGGSYIAAAGVGAGLGLGIAISALIGHYNLIPLDAEIYLIGALPIDISVSMCGMIAVFCLGAGVITSALAARNLANVPVAEGLMTAR